MTAEAKFRIGDPVRIIGGHEHLFDQVGTIVSFHPGGTKYRYNVAVGGMDNLRFKDSELILADVAPRTVHIVVHGTPAPQGSKKHVGRGRMVESSKSLPAWRSAVEAAARLATGPSWAPLDGPLSVKGTVSIRKPAKTQFHTAPAGPPDLDKIQRGIGDALTIAGTIKDDARIVHWDIRKVWADNVPGANLTITQEQP